MNCSNKLIEPKEGRKILLLLFYLTNTKQNNTKYWQLSGMLIQEQGQPSLFTHITLHSPRQTSRSYVCCHSPTPDHHSSPHPISPQGQPTLSVNPLCLQGSFTVYKSLFWLDLSKHSSDLLYLSFSY